MALAAVAVAAAAEDAEHASRGDVAEHAQRVAEGVVGVRVVDEDGIRGQRPVASPGTQPPAPRRLRPDGGAKRTHRDLPARAVVIFSKSG